MLPDLLLESGPLQINYSNFRVPTVKTTVFLRYNSLVGLIGFGRAVAALGRKRKDRGDTLLKLLG
jgi:hypothetical protein